MRSSRPVAYVDRRVGDKPWQRTAAVGSLAAGAIGVGSLVWFGLGRPAHLVLLVLGALAVLFLGFTALTSVGLRRIAAGVAAVVIGLGVVIGTIVKDLSETGVQWPGVVGLAALAVAVVLGRYALRVLPPRGHDLWAVPKGGPSAQRGVLIANPGAGGGKVERFGLVDQARRRGVEVVVLGPDDDLEALARRAADQGADALGVAGGDGSLGVVARVCIERDLPFVCVPAGTRNHFALDLGLDRTDPTMALAAFVNGEEHRIDHATVNGRVFLNNVSLGVYAAAVREPGYRDAKVETALSLVPQLVARGGPWFDLHFDVPGEGRLDGAALVQVSNGAYELAGPNFGRRRRLDAGKLGVVVVEAEQANDLVALTLLTAAGYADRASGVRSWATDRFVVDSPRPEVAAGVDGEQVTLEPPLDIRVVPRGLRVLVPVGTGIGLDAQHLGAGGVVSGLLEVGFNLGGPTAAPAAEGR